ncbi:MAG: PEGA domain-containing protein, partial [Myxococcales bacterium]|nr:PEGA domain-containing protein [Myxococcales bacterium]
EPAPVRAVAAPRPQPARPEPAPPVERPVPSGPPIPVAIATSGGWAQVSVDGVGVGNTPLRVPLAPGRHTVVLVPGSGGAPIRRTIEVGPGHSNRLHVAL